MPLVVDRSARTRMTFSGAKAAESLTGLVTSDVLSLVPGRGQYAAALSPKGKVIADLRIFARDGDLLVDMNPAAASGFVAMIRKYVNPRLARYVDVTATTTDLGVFGDGAGGVVAAVLGADQPVGAESFSHTTVTWHDVGIMAVRAPDYGVEGIDLIAPAEITSALRDALGAAGGVPSSDAPLTASRIAAGRPEWGPDMDDSVLAQEVDLDRLDAISFTKGCYTGQETVARVHYRGHVNRHLRGLRLASAPLPPVGTMLVDDNGKDVGSVRSSAESPTLGLIALALLRREIEPGSIVHARWDDAHVEARVSALPIAD